jgi:predicted RNA-binding Zn ribbon-like protein
LTLQYSIVPQSPASLAFATFDRVNFDAYAHRAVALVNGSLASVSDLGRIYEACGWEGKYAEERDLAPLRKAQRRLREVFELGAGGSDEKAVAACNSLMEIHPVQPRITAHDASGDWHMHVTGRGAAMSAEFIAGAVWGLAVWLCEYGSARFGVCADERCGNVYLDTSSNCCRRFCSERCATRSHVAAHRARKKAAPELTPVA